MLSRLKTSLLLSWTYFKYLWAIWFLLLFVLIYYFCGPFKVRDTLSQGAMFMNTLSPRFYVALTGTSSLISGIILIFEWWYFKKFGTSFIEQFSLTHLSPLLGPAVSDDDEDNENEQGSNGSSVSSVHECKIIRNPLCLFRAAEYQRYYQATGREPLTYYDMNLSAQEHQTNFVCNGDLEKPEYEAMQYAWRERNPQERVFQAHRAIEKDVECVPAYILLAEEEASTLLEVESRLRHSLKLAEVNYKKSQSLQNQGESHELIFNRDATILFYIKRRLGMCMRKMGRMREAVKIFKDLLRDSSCLSELYNVHENLIEALLETQSYADVHALLSRYDDVNYPKSATICYTSALLKARLVADKFSPDVAYRKGLTHSEAQAIEAIHKAVEFNPHVPQYLLEMRRLVLPPEHILKRGDSEALAYTFFHLPHWKRIDGVLNLLHCTWEGTFRMIPYPLERGYMFYPYPASIEQMDKELLPPFHEVSVYPKKELPFFILFTAALCSVTALMTLLTHNYPQPVVNVAKKLVYWTSAPLLFVANKLELLLPSNIIHHLSKL